MMGYKTVLFVGSGIGCRSTMAASLLDKTLNDEHSGDAPQVVINSTGIDLDLNREINTFARFVMEENKVDLTTHDAISLTDEVVAEHDLLLAMDEKVKEELTLKFPTAGNKVHTVKEFSGLPEGKGIPDPNGMGLEVYYDCALYLKVCMERILEKHFKA